MDDALRAYIEARTARLAATAPAWGLLPYGVGGRGWSAAPEAPAGILGRLERDGASWDDPAVQDKVAEWVNSIGIPGTLTQRGVDVITRALAGNKLAPGVNAKGMKTMLPVRPVRDELVGMLHHGPEALKHARIYDAPANLPIAYGHAGVTHGLQSRVYKDSMLPEWVAEIAAKALSRRSQLTPNPDQPGKIISSMREGGNVFSAYLQPLYDKGRQVGWDLYKAMTEGKGGLGPEALSKIAGKENAPAGLAFPQQRFGPLLDPATGLPVNPVVSPQSLLDFAERRYR